MKYTRFNILVKINLRDCQSSLEMFLELLVKSVPCGLSIVARPGKESFYKPRGLILSSEKRRQAAVLHKNLRWARNVRRATWPLGPDGGRAFATAACRSFSLSTVLVWRGWKKIFEREVQGARGRGGRG